MKRMIFALLTCCVVFSENTIAQKASSSSLDFPHFKPVPWTLTLAQAEFVLENDADRNEIIQITHKSGSFSTFKFDGNGELSCNAGFGGDSHQLSSVCVLLPGEKLHIELDFSYLKDAQGTYQIAFEK